MGADQRLCPFCEHEVENEIHFLLECPIYKGLREADGVFRLDEQNMSEREKFIITSRSIDILMRFFSNPFRILIHLPLHLFDFSWTIFALRGLFAL